MMKLWDSGNVDWAKLGFSNAYRLIIIQKETITFEYLEGGHLLQKTAQMVSSSDFDPENFDQKGLVSLILSLELCMSFPSAPEVNIPLPEYKIEDMISSNQIHLNEINARFDFYAFQDLSEHDDQGVSDRIAKLFTTLKTVHDRDEQLTEPNREG